MDQKVIFNGSDKRKSDTSLNAVATWRDDTPDGRLQSITGELMMTDQPGTFIFQNSNLRFTCK